MECGLKASVEYVMSQTREVLSALSQFEGALTSKLLSANLECLKIYNQIFCKANCKILNILDQTCGQIYEIVLSDIFENPENEDDFTLILETMS